MGANSEAVVTKNAETVRAFGRGQNEVNRSAIEGLLAEDANFFPGAKGIKFEGRDAFLDGLFDWLNKHETGQFTVLNEFYTEDEAFNEWHFVARTRDGQDVDTHGVDYFKLRDGKIILKSSFRKM